MMKNVEVISMSSIRRFFSAIGEGLVGLWRNISMGIASIVSICLRASLISIAPPYGLLRKI